MGITRIEINPTDLHDRDHKILLRQLLLRSKLKYWPENKAYYFIDNQSQSQFAIVLNYSIFCRKRNSKKYLQYLQDAQSKRVIFDEYQRNRYEIFSDKKSLGGGAEGVVYPSLGTIAITGASQSDIDCKLQTKSGYTRVIKQGMFDHNKHGHKDMAYKIVQEFNVTHLVGERLGNEDYFHVKPPVIIDANAQVIGFITMRRLQGKNLYQHLQQLQLTVDQRLLLMVDILKALKKIHDVGVIHRDIKPENIMVDLVNPFQPRAFIIDLGFAVEETIAKMEGRCLGTPGYIAPEIIQHQGATKASDIFSMGRVISAIWNADDPNVYFMNFIDSNSHSKDQVKATTSYSYTTHDQLLFYHIEGLSIREKEQIRSVLIMMDAADPLKRPCLEDIISQFEHMLLSRVEKKKRREYFSDILLEFVNDPDISQSNIIKTIFQTVPLEIINHVVDDLFENEHMKKRFRFSHFKWALGEFQLAHIYEIYSWQITLKHVDDLAHVETFIKKQFIYQLKEMIEKIRWYVSCVGGTRVVLDIPTREICYLPRHVAAIYALCQEATNAVNIDANQWDHYFCEINAIGRQAASHVTFFRKKQTQVFYRMFDNAYQTVLNQHMI